MPVEAARLKPVGQQRQEGGSGKPLASVIEFTQVPRRPAAPQGRPKAAQAQPLGEPLVDELLQDSFLRRIATQFFQMLHEERAQVKPELAEQARETRLHGCVLLAFAQQPHS